MVKILLWTQSAHPWLQVFCLDRVSFVVGSYGMTGPII